MVFHSYYILKGLAEDDFRWRQFYIYYGFIQLFLVTLRSALNAVTGHLMWIDHRNVSGGPFAYYITLSGNWYGISVVICAILSFALTDALLVRQFYLSQIFNPTNFFLRYFAVTSYGTAIGVS